MGLKRLFIVLVVAALLPLFSGGCEKELPYNEWEYQMNLTTFKTFPEPMFILDSGVKLIPENASSVLPLLSDNERLLLLYEYIDAPGQDENFRKIRVNSYARTYCDSVSSISLQELGIMADDPIFLTSIWQEGNFVNIRLSIDINKEPHNVNLFYVPEISNDTLMLVLRHDKRGDIPGYLNSEYFSYDIEKQKEGYSVLSVRMNTSNYGIKNCVFPLE